MKRTFSLILLTVLLGVLLCGCEIQHGDPGAAAPAPVGMAEEPDLREELTLVLNAGELETLEQYPNLKQVDLSGSTCYEEILSYIQSHPEIRVLYTVTLTGSGEDVTLKNTDTALTLPVGGYCPSLLENAAYLPALTVLELGETDATAEELSALEEAFPEAAVHYTVTLLGKSYDETAETVDLSALTAAEVDEVCEKLPRLRRVRSAELMAPKAGGTTTVSSVGKAEAIRLADACPGVNFHYVFELFGQMIDTGAERVEYKNAEIGDDGVSQIREILPLMTHLNYLLLDDCGIGDETMAQLREDCAPDIKVVWRIHFSGDGYNCLTDTEKIWATGTVTDGYTAGLKYCNDVKYIDMGHNCITNIDFVSYMPKLEVAIFSITWVESAEPLGNCPNLEYLEIFNSRISDISALANCTNLRHVNVSFLSELTDVTPLLSLEAPERIRVTCLDKVPQEQIDALVERFPDCQVTYGRSDPSKSGEWRWVNDEKDGERVPRYALLCEQFGYDDFDYSR